MKFTTEMLEKAKTAKTAEELLELAKAENVEMTAEEAAKCFAVLHKSGELSDEELGNVAGGCGGNGPSDSGAASRPENVVFLYEVGQYVEVFRGICGTTRLKIDTRRATRYKGEYLPDYGFRINGTLEWYFQYDIERQ